jgi:hypothetical protein
MIIYWYCHIYMSPFHEFEGYLEQVNINQDPEDRIHITREARLRRYEAITLASDKNQVLSNFVGGPYGETQRVTVKVTNPEETDIEIEIQRLDKMIVKSGVISESGKLGLVSEPNTTRITGNRKKEIWTRQKLIQHKGAFWVELLNGQVRGVRWYDNEVHTELPTKLESTKAQTKFIYESDIKEPSDK